jgi:hypothetical protein
MKTKKRKVFFAEITDDKSNKVFKNQWSCFLEVLPIADIKDNVAEKTAGTNVSCSPTVGALTAAFPYRLQRSQLQEDSCTT